MNTPTQYGFTTTILHGDRQKAIEHGSLRKPIHTSVPFGYKDARELAAVFQGKQPGYRYGRQGNPTVSALEDKITKMEDGASSICFATGMAAIGALTQALLRAGDHVVSSAFLFGNTNSLFQTLNGQGFDISFVDTTNVQNVEAAITPATKIVFLTSPNNPTGNLVRQQDVIRLLRHDVIVAVDEAYFEFSGRTLAPLTAEYDNLVILRTFSKWAGLAGMRAGYGVYPRWIADEVWRVKQPYNVNIAAQVAIPAVFEEMPYMRQTIRRIRLERLRMYRALRKLNFLQPLESKANFLLVRVLHGTNTAVQDWLEDDGIFIRRYSSPDLKNYIRISVGRPEDTDRLMIRLTQLAQRYAREM